MIIGAIMYLKETVMQPTLNLYHIIALNFLVEYIWSLKSVLQGHYYDVLPQDANDKIKI